MNIDAHLCWADIWVLLWKHIEDDNYFSALEILHVLGFLFPISSIKISVEEFNLLLIYLFRLISLFSKRNLKFYNIGWD